MHGGAAACHVTGTTSVVRARPAAPPTHIRTHTCTPGPLTLCLRPHQQARLCARQPAPAHQHAPGAGSVQRDGLHAADAGQHAGAVRKLHGVQRGRPRCGCSGCKHGCASALVGGAVTFESWTTRPAGASRPTMRPTCTAAEGSQPSAASAASPAALAPRSRPAPTRPAPQTGPAGVQGRMRCQFTTWERTECQAAHSQRAGALAAGQLCLCHGSKCRAR